MSDLKSIFTSLVPENIRDIPVVKQSIDIFISTLEENSAISWDISNIQNNSLNLPADDITLKSKTNLRKGYLEKYLSTLYSIVKKVQSDNKLQTKLINAGITDSAIFNTSAEKILGLEHFTTNKDLKTRIGTISGIEQTHGFASKLESGLSETPLITSEKPFHLLVEASLSSDMYASIVEPISHPVGFTYDYLQIIETNLLDLFGLEKVFTVNAIEIRGSSGDYSVFTELPEPQATTNVWADFQTRINIVTGLPFTLQEFLALVTVYSDKIVSDVITNQITNLSEFTILFQDASLIYKRNDEIKFINGTTTTDFAANGLSHYSLFSDLSYELEITYTDVIERFVIDFEISAVNDATGQSGGITYKDSNGNLIPIDTSDFIIMDSTEYVNSDISLLAYSVEGVYFVTNDNQYFTSADVNFPNGVYLTSQPPLL